MRTISTALRNHLAAGRNGWVADLWTFALPTGTVLRWTDADIPVTWGGNTYDVGPLLERSRLSWRLGLSGGDESDLVRLHVTPRAADTVGAVPLALALHQGDFDGAIVSLARAFGGTPGVVVDAIDSYFVGRVGPIEADDFAFTMTIYAPTYDLETPFPRNIVQPQCGNRLFDEVCGLAAASYRTTGSVTGGVNAARTQFQTSLSLAADYCTLGRFKWLTGANAGRSQIVRAHTTPNGVLTFAAPWPAAVSAGETFEVFAGCDKRQSTCAGKFSNIVHFRGMPFVPAAEATT